MPVTFETRAFANITMLNDVAVEILKIMGQSGSVPGAIKGGDVSQILELFTKAVAERKEEFINGESTRIDIEPDERVKLGDRAIPIIQLLEAADKENCDVLWYYT